MEPPKEQKPIPLDYASPSSPPWVEWSVGKRIILGLGLTVLWLVLVFGALMIDLGTGFQAPATVLLFPFGWLARWGDFDDTMEGVLFFANGFTWGFGIAFILHRRWWRRGA